MLRDEIQKILGLRPRQQINPEYALTHRQTYSEITLLHQIDTDGTLWGSCGRKVLYRRPGEEWAFHSEFPLSMPRDAFSFSRITTRLSRSDKCNVHVTRKGHVLGIRAHRVYHLKPSQEPTLLFSISGDCSLHGTLCEDPDGWIYFGEYFMNPKRREVKLWKVAPDLSSHEVAHCFAPGSIRHIHGVFADPYEPGVLWCSVGDYLNECYLFRSDDQFQTIKRYGEGTQRWRAVHLFFTEDHVCWLTDTECQQNYACRMDRNTGDLELGQEIIGSSWYGTTTVEGTHIAFSVVEPGYGGQSDRAFILVSDDAFRWHATFSFKKDFFVPMGKFKYGVICCPSGPMKESALYISGEGLFGIDGCSLQMSLKRLSAPPDKSKSIDAEAQAHNDP